MAGALSLGGCGSPEDETQGRLTYCDIEPIFMDRCLRCHGDPVAEDAPFSLSTYEEVAAETVGIERAVRTGFMPLTALKLTPPVEPLTDEERDTILDWLDDGAPAGSCD
jgi:uncharacterized membrane protein